MQRLTALVFWNQARAAALRISVWLAGTGGSAGQVDKCENLLDPSDDSGEAVLQSLTGNSSVGVPRDNTVKNG